MCLLAVVLKEQGTHRRLERLLRACVLRLPERRWVEECKPQQGCLVVWQWDVVCLVVRHKLAQRLHTIIEEEWA